MSRTALVVIPTLNEERHIGSLLDQLTRLPAGLVPEILVADGRSTDGTRAVVAARAARDPRVRLVDNPARLQGAGINRAEAEARSAADTIVRIDAHARYPDDFVPQVLRRFPATGADMVAVRLDTRGETCLQRGIAAASNSLAGTGGSAHRVGGFSGFVDHGHHAGLDRAAFRRLGGYDEGFTANEDGEFDYRVRRAGGRIWLAGEIEVGYAPRRSLGALFTQYRRYGAGRAQTFLKHRERLRLRQVLPPLVSVGIAGSLVLSPFVPALLVVPAGYLAALGAVAAGLAYRGRDRCALAAAPAMAVMHLTWGLSFAATVLKRAVFRGSPPAERGPAERTEVRYGGGSTGGDVP